MRIKELLHEMSYQDAVAIFRKYGFDVTGMDPAALRAARNTLIKKHHQDITGNKGADQEINPAYEILSGKSAPQAAPSRPGSGWGDRYGGRGGYYGGRGEDWTDYGAEPPPPPPGGGRTETPIWAMAGHSGGYPPNASIHRNDFTDVNYIKKAMWELSGKSTTAYTIWGFDGHFFRNSTTVFGSPKIFNTMADAMVMWQSKGGNAYDTRAVFVSPDKSQELYLIYADGNYYGDNPIPVEHDSFNRNPGNDQQFTRKLPEFLDQLKAKNSQ